MRRWLAVLLGCSLAGFFGVLAFRKVDWSAALTAMRCANWALLALIPALLALSPLLRAARWRVILASAPQATIPNLFRAAGIGIAANYALPGKLGEAFCAHALGRLIDRSRLETLGVLVVSRLADLFVLFALVVAGTFVLAEALPDSFRVVGWSIVLLTAALLLAAMLMRLCISAEWIQRLTDRVRARLGEGSVGLIQKLSYGLFVFRTPWQLVAFVACTALLWLVLAAALWVAMRAFHLPVAPQIAPILLAISAVGAMIPSAPANVGTYHFFGVFALGLAGVGQDTAAACVIAYHALDVTTAFLLGGICLVSTRSPVWFFRRMSPQVRVGEVETCDWNVAPPNAATLDSARACSAVSIQTGTVRE